MQRWITAFPVQLMSWNPDWVIKCAKRIHPKVGISYVGNKWQLMALLIFLEKEHSKEEMEREDGSSFSQWYKRERGQEPRVFH
jgi:hypothetical protein